MKVQRRIWFGYSITLIFFLIVTLVGNYTYKQLQIANQWVTHTHKVLGALEAITSVMKDAETGQRGYLLTSKENYLEPYNSALLNIPLKLKIIENLIDDNPQQQKEINQIKVLVDRKMAELDETIQLHRSGRAEEALKLVLTDQGKNIMDDIRVSFEEVLAVENNLLAYRSAVSNQAVDYSTWIIYGGSFFILLIAGLVAYLTSKTIGQEYIKLQTTQKSLFTTNQELVLKTTKLKQSYEEISAFELKIKKEKEKIYMATIHSAQHVTNNLLNQLMIVKHGIEETPQFDADISSMFDEMLTEAKSLMFELSSVDKIEDEKIRQSVKPI
ncbi:MAG: CHASE3 domain sensor protein [Francisellaceae bacterium]|jgi:CHASE3 domain sensor protein|uniref:CHASE3 domain-containing protein n=1 Tax=Colwellia sp. BRX10-4 TaxID=2759843 RepID=UPI0015F599F9|nr:CHASE3 domain-containing protein [Colwellia sp. BRX10-4]MBA6396939.1 CHASE3 domain-containing protein [Colwellia sp. BRX10-4]